MRTAFIAAIKDSAFQEEADKMQSEAVPQTGEELEAMVKKMFATSSEMIERLNKILQ